MRGQLFRRITSLLVEQDEDRMEPLCNVKSTEFTIKLITTVESRLGRLDPVKDRDLRKRSMIGFTAIGRRSQAHVKRIFQHDSQKKNSTLRSIQNSLPELFDDSLVEEFLSDIDSQPGEPDLLHQPLGTHRDYLSIDRLRVDITNGLQVIGMAPVREYVMLLAAVFPENRLIDRLSRVGWTRAQVRLVWGNLSAGSQTLLRTLASQPERWASEDFLADSLGVEPAQLSGPLANISRRAGEFGPKLPNPISGKYQLTDVWANFVNSIVQV